MRTTAYPNEYNLIVRGDAEICSFSAKDKAAINERYRSMRDYAAVKGREVIVRRRDHRIAALAVWSTLLWVEDVPSPQSVFEPKGFEALDKPLQALYSYLIGTKADLAFAAEQAGVPLVNQRLGILRKRLLTLGGIFQCDGCEFWCSTNDLTCDGAGADAEFVCESCYHWRSKGYK
jgi:hypothetical protein